METVILVVHLLIAIALIATVLLQRSEGGALGIGGGGGGGGFMSARGTANVLTRTTAILAGAFFLTSIVLTILAKGEAAAPSILDTAPDAPAAVPMAPIDPMVDPMADPMAAPMAPIDGTATDSAPSVPVGDDAQ